jgi:acyl-CoA synthetase (AMP-forming)/AMP-acid ligase II
VPSPGAGPDASGGDLPASILFTSGSTGPPKGVTQTHASLARGCDTVAGVLGLSPADRILCPIPWSFDYGYGQLLSTLLLGIPQILPANTTPMAVWDAIGQHRPSVLAGVPSLFTWLLRGPARPDGIDLSCLRAVTNTGGALPEAVLTGMLDLFAGAEIFLNYGLTESYRTSCLDPTLVRRFPGSVGKPIPGVSLEIRREDGALADAGEVGEVVQRGGSLFRGYWGDDEATARALRADPADPAAPPVLFTGDLGRIDEHGLLTIVGRRDHQMKSMGVRVNPSEIEALLDASGLVAEVAVFGVPHDLMGHEVWAAVVPRADDPDTERKLSAWAQRTMSRYMKPRRFLVKDALPRTHTGKVDRGALVREAERSPSRSLLG